MCCADFIWLLLHCLRRRRVRVVWNAHAYARALTPQESKKRRATRVWFSVGPSDKLICDKVRHSCTVVVVVAVFSALFFLHSPQMEKAHQNCQTHDCQPIVHFSALTKIGFRFAEIRFHCVSMVKLFTMYLFQFDGRPSHWPQQIKQFRFILFRFGVGPLFRSKQINQKYIEQRRLLPSIEINPSTNQHNRSGFHCECEAISSLPHWLSMRE